MCLFLGYYVTLIYVGIFNANTILFCFLNLFILFYLFLAVLCLRCGVRASHCGGFSCCGAQALGVRASVVVACGL